MEIAKNSVVLFRYVLKNEAGEILEDTQDGDPIAILIGHGNVIRGLQRALQGHQTGDQFSVAIEPLDAYGSRKPDSVQRFSKKYFHDAKRLKTGMQTVLRTKETQQQVTVVKVGGKMIDVDINHPLAGERLHFELDIVDVREASASELAHGHAHADGLDHH